MRNDGLSCMRVASRLAFPVGAIWLPGRGGRAALVLPFAWACAACGVAGTPPGVKHSLAEINGNSSFSIEFALPATGPNLGSLPEGEGGAGTSSVTLGTWSHGEANVCPVLGPETVATLNGTVLRAVSLGWFGGGVCQVAQWTVSDPGVFSLPTLTVRISDSTGELVANFVNVASPRTVAVVSPASAVAYVGDVVTVQLSPGTDVFQRNPADEQHFGDVGAEFPGWRGLASVAEVAFGGSFQTGTFTVPDVVGDGGLFLAEMGTVGTTRCDVGHCELPLSTKTPVVPFVVLP